VEPIQIPPEWNDHGLITFEEFCDLIRTPQRTVRDWRRRGVGPRWARFNGCGRLYLTVAEARRFLNFAITPGTDPADVDLPGEPRWVETKSSPSISASRKPPRSCRCLRTARRCSPP
jgi:hypothetical protein